MRYSFSTKTSKRFQNVSNDLRTKIDAYATSPVNCICGESSGKLIYEQDRYQLAIDFILCSKCSTIRIKNQINTLSLKDFYEHDYRNLYFDMKVPKEDLIIKEQRPRGRKIVKILQDLGIKVKDANVLEIGAGAAGILDEFQKVGAKTTALEPDQTYAEYIRREQKHDVIQAFLDSGNVHELKDETYDIIIISHVLEHLADPREILRHTSRLLNTTGCVYIEVPSTDNIGDISDKILDFFHVCHPWSFNKNSLQWLCATENLSPIYIDKYIQSVFVKDEKPKDIALISGGVYYRKLIIADVLSRLKLLGFKRKALKIIAKGLPTTLKTYIKKYFL